MSRQNRDIACAITWSCVLTPFSVAYAASISGRRRAFIDFVTAAKSSLATIVAIATAMTQSMAADQSQI
jgi:hypothetical protein